MSLELAWERSQKAEKSSVSVAGRERRPDLEPALLLETHDSLPPMLCKKRGGQPFASGAAWRVRGPGQLPAGRPPRGHCTQMPVG